MVLIDCEQTQADIINFSTTVWDYRQGPQVGWEAPATLDVPTFSGTTTLEDGTELTLTVTDHGTVTHFGDANDHLQTISTGNSAALSINQNSANSTNINGIIENYVRIDVELSRARWLNAIWHDVDTGNSWDLNEDDQPDNNDWTDIITAESHSGRFRDFGEGNTASYDIGASLEIDLSHGHSAATALSGTTNVNHLNLSDNLMMTDNSVYTSFDHAARYFSFYYWNDNPEANYGDIQRVLLGGLIVNKPPLSHLFLIRSSERRRRPGTSSLDVKSDGCRYGGGFSVSQEENDRHSPMMLTNIGGCCL